MRGRLVAPSSWPESTASDLRRRHPLKDRQLEQILALLRQMPLLGREADVRLSLAGAQDKIAVAIIDGQITCPRPDGRRPTSSSRSSRDWMAQSRTKSSA